MKLTDMKRSKQRMAEQAASPDDNPYPYGLCLHLDSPELDKLGMKTLPDVGDEYEIRAIGKVTAISSNESKENANSSVSLQITMMKAMPESEGSAGSDSHAEDKAEAAETEAVTRKPKTLMHTTYRGRY
jgi:hypothetical protein